MGLSVQVGLVDDVGTDAPVARGNVGDGPTHSSSWGVGMFDD